MRRFPSIALAAAIFAIGLGAHAAAPPLVPLQGVLTDLVGVPLDGAVTVKFSLYAGETGGSALWIETQTVAVEDGLFSAYLGQNTELSLGLFRDHGTLWLGIEVGNDGEMPRVRLGSAPYGGYAEYCGQVPSHSHAASDLTGVISATSLPAGVAIGEQMCTGTDKVVGLNAAGSLLCGTDETSTDLPAGLVVGPQGCAAGSVAHAIDASGVVQCVPDANTTYTAGNGLTLAGTTFSTSALTCAAGQYSRWDGTTWLCDTDENTMYTAGNGLTMSGGVIELNASYLDGSAYDARFVNEGQASSVTSAMIVDGTIGPADVNAAAIQLRVSGTCAAGSSIRAVAQNGTVTCQAGNMTGSGTVGRLAKFTSASALGDSGVHEDAGNIGIGTATPQHKLHVAGAANVDVARVSTNVNDVTAFGSGGLHLQWDRSSADGYSYLLNQRAAGQGGFVLGEIEGATVTPVFRIESNMNNTLYTRSPNIIAGFSENSVTAGVYGATISGGGRTTYPNVVTDIYGTVGGGTLNRAGNNDATVINAGYATVGGGVLNTASGARSTVAGGESNTASAMGSTVAGGEQNTASGPRSTVAGGYMNTAAGIYSFAAGRQAKANNQGCFVWGDSTAADVLCEVNNRWVARASGGVYFYTNSTNTSGVFVPAGGNAWSTVSDRNKKEHFKSVEPKDVLERVAQMPMTTWSYKSEPGVRHMGPMAQDFHAAFGLGDSDKHLSTVDVDGVALAAIQGLYQENQSLRSTVATLELQVAQLPALEARLAKIEQQRPPAPRNLGNLGWIGLGAFAVAGGIVMIGRRRAGKGA